MCGHALPASVREMLDRYRSLHTAEGWDWGRDWRRDPVVGALALRAAIPPSVAARIGAAPELVEVLTGRRTLGDAVRAALRGAVPPAVVVVRVDPGRCRVECRTPIPVPEGHSTAIDVLLDLGPGCAAAVTLDGVEVGLPPGGAHLLSVPVASAADLDRLAIDGLPVPLGEAVTVAPAAVLRVASSAPVRWRVTDAAGGAWFPDGALRKWDGAGRPYFHAREAALVVPRVALEVGATRGIGYRTVVRQALPREDEVVALEPERLFDPRAAGWTGVELHAHLNYSGDLVVEPADALAMQAGEDLDVLNLLAGNLNTTFVYDREAFEACAGRDIARSPQTIARFGFEYRNDLLGHLHAFGARRPPARYQTGHDPAPERPEPAAPADWPPNATACEDIRATGAVVGYCHPAFIALEPGGSPDPLYADGRTVEARELVVDAALGLVDSVDLLSPGVTTSAVELYHRLLGAGVRLAASTGTDVFLSMSRGMNSDPPGWARTYVRTGGAPVTAEAVARAIRDRATFVTNGPWVELEVDGAGPGAVLDRLDGDVVRVRARSFGPGVEQLRIVSSSGVLTSATPSGAGAAVALEVPVPVHGPTWIAAEVRGAAHPDVLGQPAFAHTSPVHVRVGGRDVAEPADVAWCLAACDRLEALVRRVGRFDSETQVRDVLAVIEAARAWYRGRLVSVAA